MRLPQLGEGGPNVGWRNSVAPKVAEARRPPFQLLASLRHESRPIGDLAQERVDVRGQGARGSLRQLQGGASVQAPPSNRLQRRAGRKPPEAQLPVGTDVSVDAAVGLTPNAGLSVMSH